MANKGSSTLRQQQEQHISFGLIQPSSSTHGNFIKSKETGAFDLGELDQALFMYLNGQDSPSAQEQRRTLNIFPSQPMHVEPSTKGGISFVSPTGSGTKKSSDQIMELGNPISDPPALPDTGKDIKAVVKKEGNRKGKSISEQGGPRTPDPKTLRRLAQNREAARKSRLRKKAYVQQLENSRIKLTQLEQELQRARAQGLFFGGGALLGDQGFPPGISSLSSDAAMFDMEYAKWLEEHHRRMCNLRAAVQEHLPETELRMFVDNCVAHYEEMVNLKSIVIKSDVFHLIAGMWKTPAERCFMWMGDFRPSELIKADNLRQQTFHRLHQILTTRQMARCLLAIAEYFHRLRALSSLWLSRPRQ
uniref:BZIP transcription factor TGA10 isoform X3 n=1 Tax=Elaeis guineensis var. tenera TaxID=51953 RepID=A0A8N4F9Q6_ELAGV|nr:bZIP transcription factor TGA10 isoform X3 [Elaeis guineensis]